jgi:N-acetylglucosaminyl-diphospho-decaprenol L-rhamnosyltransferase
VSGAGLRVVVLTYGTGGEHEQLLDSLTREGIEPDRILLVHNPSTPDERQPSSRDGCEVMSASHNLGYAAGMNLGIQRQLSRGCELLLLLTHDARLRPGALPELVDAAKANPEYGVLGPILLLTGTDTPFSFGGITHANGRVEHLKFEPVAHGGIAHCDWVDGGTMLIRAESFDRAGDFDERFWGYCEDADLCLRMSRAGFRVGVVVGARADQAPGGSKRPGPWAYLLTRNGMAYAYRFAGARGLVSVTGGALLNALVELVRTSARATRLRPGSPAERWAVAVGTFLGVADFFRRRWGPPPASLPGTGDLQNVDAPSLEETTGGG